MLIGSGAVAVYLVAEAVDLRKSIDGLAQAVVDSLARQPVSGEVFVFGNRRRDKIKLLWWQPHGFWLAYYGGPTSQDNILLGLSLALDFTRSGSALPRFCL